MGGAPRSVILVADELLGYTRTGGIGTATSFLALALARMGHRVEALYTGDAPTAAMSTDWARAYDRANVTIRLLPRSSRAVEPPYFARMLDVEAALASDPPEVVVVQDLAAPAYTALRMRQLGFGFEQTLFVAYCHGTRRWITDMARKVRVLPGAHAITILEQASIELADVVVSPSRYLIEWMQQEHWQLPSTSLVIPYLTRAAAVGEPPPEPAAVAANGVERIAFFGRLEERKGLRPFAAGLNRLEPELLRGRELEFVGAATPAWPPRHIESLLSADVRRALSRISFATDLDQPEALARLSRPGTLAVMPSLGETFSNAVYECLERGIAFIASDAGAPRELVAEDDRTRVLFEPTPDGVASALRRALREADALRPARPAFRAEAAYDAWADVVRMTPQPDRVHRERSPTDDFILLVAEHDEPGPHLEETFRAAQAASSADVVTCGVRLGTTDRLFLGDPGGLGLIENHYGAAALVRRSLIADDGESMWPLLARLATGGARIVSLPRAFVERREPAIADGAAEALAVAQRFEERLPAALRSLARLTVGLAAANATAAPQSRSRLRRLLDRTAGR